VSGATGPDHAPDRRIAGSPDRRIGGPTVGWPDEHRAWNLGLVGRRGAVSEPGGTVRYSPEARWADLVSGPGWIVRYRDGAHRQVASATIAPGPCDGGSPQVAGAPAEVEDRVETLLRELGYATARTDPAPDAVATWDLTPLDG